MSVPTKFEGLDFVKINNAIAARHKDMERVESFKNDDDARAIVNTALQAMDEHLIRVLKPTYVKRGDAAKYWARYKDGMFVSQFIDKCITDGGTRNLAVRNINYDNKKGLIKVY
jgi:hypothetical protein